MDHHLKTFIQEIFITQNISFIGSVDEKGFPTIRAMLRPRRFEEVHTLYFSTNAPTNKVRHFMDNTKACVYICDPINFQGVLLKGHMEILTDYEHKQMLWRAGDELYYPDGVNDPNYCVLRFTALNGRIYNNLNSDEFTL